MNSVADAFALPFRDSGWVGKIAVQGLILIIPIVGQIAALGWLMITFDNYRAGRYELAPAGFHLARGIGLFGLVVIYSIVLQIPGFILTSIGGAMVANNNSGAGPFIGFGSLLRIVGELVVFFLWPSLIVSIHRGGFAAGLDVPKVWAMATSNPSNGVIAGLMVFVSYLISVAGIIVCCIGVLFTTIYAGAIQAGVATWFEGAQAAPGAPAGPQIPPPTPAA